jgi:hypothetical protein
VGTSQSHQGDITRSASLSDSGIKDGDYGKSGGEKNVNHAVSRIANWSAVALGAGSCDTFDFAPYPPPASERSVRLVAELRAFAECFCSVTHTGARNMSPNGTP